MLNWMLLLVAIIIIVSLGAYALLLLRRVKAVETRRDADFAKLEEKLAEQRQHRNRSIQVLAQGVLADQLTMTEAAIRIRGLLDGLDIDDLIRDEFKAFYQLSEAAAHIPILEEWKKLKLKQRLAFDKERQQLEATHKEFIEDAAKRILGREF